MEDLRKRGGRATVKRKGDSREGCRRQPGAKRSKKGGRASRPKSARAREALCSDDEGTSSGEELGGRNGGDSGDDSDTSEPPLVEEHGGSRMDVGEPTQESDDGVGQSSVSSDGETLPMVPVLNRDSDAAPEARMPTKLHELIDRIELDCVKSRRYNFGSSVGDDDRHVFRTALDMLLNKLGVGGEALEPRQMSRTLQGVKESVHVHVVHYAPSKWSHSSPEPELGDLRRRLYGNGCQRMPGWVRRRLTYKNYHDIDIVNCHPALLVQLGKKLCVQVAKWEQYTENREEILSELSDKFGLPRSAAKTAMLVTLFGGSTSSKEFMTPEGGDRLELSEGQKQGLKEYMAPYKAEIRGLLNVLKRVDRYMPFLNYASQNIALGSGTQSEHRRDFSFLSHVLQHLECCAIDNLYHYMHTNGVEVGVNCFDGLMVRNKRFVKDSGRVVDYVMDQKELDAMSAYCSFEGFVVEFCCKSLHPTDEDQRRIRHPFGDYLQDNPYTVSNIHSYAIDRITKLKESVGPEMVKTVVIPEIVYMLNHVIALIRVERKYLLQELGDDGKTKYIEVQHKDIQSFQISSARVELPYMKMTQGNLVEMSETKTLWDIWRASTHKLEYSARSFSPVPYTSYPGPQCPPPSVRNLNTFEGLAYRKTADLTPEEAKVLRETKLKPFCDHVFFVMANGDERVYDWIMKFFALTILRPWVKSKVSFIMKSHEGAGKGVLVRLLERAIGERYCSTPNSIEMATTGFNEPYIDGKLLMFLDEACWAGNHKTVGPLKKLITEKDYSVDRKHCDSRTITNHLNVVMASNEEHVVKVTPHNRRYMVVNCSDKYCNRSSSDYFKAIINTDIQLMVNFLATFDLEKWQEDAFPPTFGIDEQKLTSLGKYDRVVYDIIQSPALLDEFVLVEQTRCLRERFPEFGKLKVVLASDLHNMVSAKANLYDRSIKKFMDRANKYFYDDVVRKLFQVHLREQMMRVRGTREHILVIPQMEDLKINFAKLQNIQLSSLGDTDSVAANPDDVEGLDY